MNCISPVKYLRVCSQMYIKIHITFIVDHSTQNCYTFPFNSKFLFHKVIKSRFTLQSKLKFKLVAVFSILLQFFSLLKLL